MIEPKPRRRRPRYLPDPKSIPLFRCSSCFALYQVTEAKAPETADLKTTCEVCSAPLPARREEVALKYFFLRKATHGRPAGAAWVSAGKPQSQEAVDEKALGLKRASSRFVHGERIDSR
jgi:hypothetical protein